MAQLYVNSKGFPVRGHSYSGGDLWRYCPRKYKLQRIDGWQERRRSSAMDFGNCIEAAIQAHILRGADPVAEFEKLWLQFDSEIGNLCAHPGPERPCAACRTQAERNANLEYSKTDRDWPTMHAMGVDLMKLFTARLPGLPIASPRFAIEMDREIFPGTQYAGIKVKAILDIISRAPLDHPLLPEAVTSENEKSYRPLIIDVKTSGKSYPDDPRMVALDPQLRTYAWMTGIPDVAFLVLGKAGAELKRDREVSLLAKVNGFEAGTEMVCIEPASDKQHWYVLPNQPDVLEALEKFTKGLEGKPRTVRRLEFLTNAGTAARTDELTTQRLQFLAARISEEAAAEQGAVIGQQVVEIVSAAERDFYPMQGGIRWPNDKCLNCPMRGICSGNDALRDELVYKPDEVWLEEEVEVTA
jgi:hypothetical protein